MPETYGTAEMADFSEALLLNKVNYYTEMKYEYYYGTIWQSIFGTERIGHNNTATRNILICYA